MAWLLWLLAPVVPTAIAAVLSWLRGRPAPLPDTDESMRAHSDYLAALSVEPRSAQRGLDRDTV